MFLVELEIEANKRSVLEQMDITIDPKIHACSFLSQLPYWYSIATEDRSSPLRK